MSDSDQAHQALELLDYLDRPEVDRPGFNRRAFLRRTALTGVAAGSVGGLLSACGSSASSSSGSGTGFGGKKTYKFVFVNHVTTNVVFVPTQDRIQDACKLLGCTYQWTGSESSNVNQMVNAMNSAVTSGADGIAVSLVDLHAFNGPTEAALKAGIPVLSYNADAPGNARLSYTGQDLKLAGEKMGARIVAAVPPRGAGLFVAAPRAAHPPARPGGAEQGAQKNRQPHHLRNA